MTDATERRLAAMLAQLNEMLDARLPDQMPAAPRPDWQLWIFVFGIVFYAGISWVMIQQNSASIEKILLAHRADMKTAQENLGDIETSLISHINDENNRNLARSEQIRKQLEDRLRGQK